MSDVTPDTPEMAEWRKRQEELRNIREERMKQYESWQVGDLVYVHYKNRYYGEILDKKKTEYGYQITVRRLYDEWGATTTSRIRGTYDASYMDMVDKKYVKKWQARAERVIELFEQHNYGQRH